MVITAGQPYRAEKRESVLPQTQLSALYNANTDFPPILYMMLVSSGCK
jgi:hypothetical protein